MGKASIPPRLARVLAEMRRDKKVLERVGRQKRYSLLWHDRKTFAGTSITSADVSSLYAYLDAYDGETGEPLGTVSALGNMHIVWRLKPDVVLP